MVRCGEVDSVAVERRLSDDDDSGGGVGDPGGVGGRADPHISQLKKSGFSLWKVQKAQDQP